MEDLWDKILEFYSIRSHDGSDGRVAKKHSNLITNFLTAMRKTKEWNEEPSKGTSTDDIWIPLNDHTLNLEDINVTNLDSNTKGILWNDFDERANNGVRYKVDFINGDKTIGDKKIPVSKISRYYSIKDGKLKVGGIELFNDSDMIIPIRNSDMILDDKVKSLQYKDSIASLVDSLYNLLPSKYKDKRSSNYKSYGSKFRSRALLNSDPKNTKYQEYNLLLWSPLNSLFNLPKHGKFVLYDENGENPVFISSSNPDLQAKKYIEQYGPAHSILVDNGRFEPYIWNPLGGVSTTAYFTNYPAINRSLYGVTVK